MSPTPENDGNGTASPCPTSSQGLKVSVIVPCLNEKGSVLPILERVKAAFHGFASAEVIVVDDGSTDGTHEQLLAYPELYTHLLRHENARGKGAAIATALNLISGDTVVIQDADTEYWPEDLPLVLGPILRKDADVVYGRRPSGTGSVRRRLTFGAGVLLFSFLARHLTSLPIHDIATCYKAFRTEVLHRLSFREKGFAWDAEVTARLAAFDGLRLLEIPIRYAPRTRIQGKKLRFWHGFRYGWVLLTVAIRSRLARSSRGQA